MGCHLVLQVVCQGLGAPYYYIWVVKRELFILKYFIIQDNHVQQLFQEPDVHHISLLHKTVINTLIMHTLPVKGFCIPQVFITYPFMNVDFLFFYAS